MSMIPLGTHVPYSYQKIPILYVPTLSLRVFFNYAFIRIYSIHLNKCSRVNVYTKTVQST